jgi:hypothetical protein
VSFLARHRRPLRVHACLCGWTGQETEHERRCSGTDKVEKRAVVADVDPRTGNRDPRRRTRRRRGGGTRCERVCDPEMGCGAVTRGDTAARTGVSTPACSLSGTRACWCVYGFGQEKRGFGPALAHTAEWVSMAVTHGRIHHDGDRGSD